VGEEVFHALTRTIATEGTTANRGGSAHRLARGSTLAGAFVGTVSELLTDEGARSRTTLNDMV
jgi:hypothetical protein